MATEALDVSGIDAYYGDSHVLHAVSFIPISLMGFVFLAQDGLSFGRLRRLAPVAGTADAAPAVAFSGPPADGGLA